MRAKSCFLRVYGSLTNLRGPQPTFMAIPLDSIVAQSGWAMGLGLSKWRSGWWRGNACAPCTVLFLVVSVLIHTPIHNSKCALADLHDFPAPDDLARSAW